jgi:8-oxo-dGTP diphosphatase
MEQRDQKFYVGLKAFVGNGKKLLILEDKDGQWELPGEKIQVGEDIPKAFHREIKEELGESIEIERGPLSHVWIRQPNPNQNFFIFLVGFPCALKSGEITISPEHKSFRWITKEEVESIDFENTYKDAIQYYFSKF